MKPFIFHNPAKIIFGSGVSSQLAENAKPLGHKALLVYGQNSIKANCLYDKLINQLKEHRISFIEHGGVSSNPNLSHAREGVAKAVKNNVDYIIAVGGGSVIDESKAIAAAAASQVDIWDFFTGLKPVTKALPLITMLTIPATGSEMNGNMVITNERTNEKLGLGNPLLYPKVSLLDPELTYTIPASYTAYSAVDMISHLTESYFNNDGGWTPIQEHYVEGMVKAVMSAAEKAVLIPDDQEARAVLMWAGSMAWNGLNTAGIGSFSMPCHTLEHPVSALYNIAHGAGLSIITPAWLQLRLPDKTAKIARFAGEVFGICKNTETETAQGGIAALKNWFIKIGAPVTFKEAGIYAPNVFELTCLAQRAAKLRNVPDLPDKLIEKIYNLCL